jgi:8-oxo-dGTP pyrophosphatase MutT (NUDIX family)
LTDTPPVLPAGEHALVRVLSGLLAQRHPEPVDARLLMDPAELAAARPAAVLLALVDSASGPAILLTRRTEHLQHHAGQVSFAGGRADPGDRDLVHTALREAEEEIGLPPELARVLGQLPEFFIPTGYRVTPVLAWLDSEPLLRADPEEVAEIFYLPARLGLDPAAWSVEEIERGGRRRPMWVMEFEGRRIWGATAAILVWLAQRLQAYGVRL